MAEEYDYIDESQIAENYYFNPDDLKNGRNVTKKCREKDYFSQNNYEITDVRLKQRLKKTVFFY